MGLYNYGRDAGMPGIGNDGLGKRAEDKIKKWLNRPDLGYSFDRLYDQMTGYFMTSRNICDFICYKHPNQYYIESKATYEDRFNFSMLTETQHDGLLEKSKIPGVHALVVVLFATYQRAFILNIRDIKKLEDSGKKSLNIKKIDKWNIPYAEIPTSPSRKSLLDYEGDLQYLVDSMEVGR